MPLRVMPILQFFRPGHPNGNIFENRVAIRNCHWFVDVADDVEVHITFDTQFGIETEENGAQCYDFMTINPDVAERVVYCGNSYQQDAVFYSKDSTYVTGSRGVWFYIKIVSTFELYLIKLLLIIRNLEIKLEPTALAATTCAISAIIIN